LGARAFNYIFIGCDMVSIVLQGVGGATAGKEADRGETPEKGRAVMVSTQPPSLILISSSLS
jgi:hypothetical protein